MPGETRSDERGVRGGATSKNQRGIGRKMEEESIGRGRERELPSRAGVIFLLPAFPARLFHPSVRLHSRQLGVFRRHPRHCFRGGSSELFARDFLRVTTRRLSLPLHGALLLILHLAARSRCVARPIGNTNCRGVPRARLEFSIYSDTLHCTHSRTHFHRQVEFD